MIIKIIDKNVKVNLLHTDEFKSLGKYKIETSSYDFMIESYKDKLFIPSYEPIRKTEFYNVYDLNGYEYQVQYQSGTVVGTIEYRDNIIRINLIKDDFATEYLLTQYAMVYIITRSNAILFHGSSFVYKNKGIILTAKSGTGKSTHSRLWQKYEDIVVVNDDKNIIRIEDGGLVLYPSPWSGKHMLDNNVKTSLDAIVFLHQASDNTVNLMSPIVAFKKILGQIDMPSEKNKEIWDETVDKLLALPIYSLGCNMDKEAYLTLKKRLEMDLCL